ncbi:unnamed protein product [Oikopleura dioica]|uniref:Uncharacterized protein n=1 Tax=Oikopleura dioica TaxID=34765 RepID=E4WQA0_OIKDI|nr:unnamed protein product [Oikopleura dioica]
MPYAGQHRNDDEGYQGSWHGSQNGGQNRRPNGWDNRQNQGRNNRNQGGRNSQDRNDYRGNFQGNQYPFRPNNQSNLQVNQRRPNNNRLRDINPPQRPGDQFYNQLAQTGQQMADMETQDRPLTQAGRVQCYRSAEPRATDDIVCFTYLDEFGNRQPSSLTLPNHNEPGCNIRVKEDRTNEQHDHFTSSVLELMTNPTDPRKLPRHRQVSCNRLSIHPMMSTGLAREGKYAYYSKKDIFHKITDGCEDYAVRINFPWTHALLSREANQRNTVELNCLVSLIAEAFERIGIPSIANAPCMITIWYLDGRQIPGVWTNRSKGASVLRGDYVALGISIDLNAIFLSFCYFNPLIMVTWSPYKYLGECELLRNYVAFISERTPNSLQPKWQFYLDCEAVRTCLQVICERFYLLIGECGNSITAFEPKVNTVLGLTSIMELMQEDTEFMRAFTLLDTEREHLRANCSKFTRDFRQSSSATTKSHRLWILQHGLTAENTKPERCYKQICTDAANRLQDIRSGPAKGGQFVETKPALEELSKARIASIEQQHKNFKQLYPKLVNDPELQEVVSKQTLLALQDPNVGEAYTENVLQGCSLRMKHQEEKIEDNHNSAKEVAKAQKNLEQRLAEMEQKHESSQALIIEQFKKEIMDLKTVVAQKDAAIKAEQIVNAAARAPQSIDKEKKKTNLRSAASALRGGAKITTAAKKLQQRGTTGVPKKVSQDANSSLSSEASSDTTEVRIRDIGMPDPDESEKMDTSKLPRGQKN